MFAASHKGSFSCVGACYVPSYSMTVCVYLYIGAQRIVKWYTIDK